MSFACPSSFAYEMSEQVFNMLHEADMCMSIGKCACSLLRVSAGTDNHNNITVTALMMMAVMGVCVEFTPDCVLGKSMNHLTETEARVA